MSAMDNPGDTSGSGAGTPPTMFVRQATGLVREGKTRDAFYYNIMWSSVALSFGFFVVLAPTFYPGANFELTVLIAGALSFGGAILYAMLTRLMPRTGGDYVFVSRTLKPFIGFSSNLSYVFWVLVSAGVYSVYLSSTIGSFFRMLVGYGASPSLISTSNWFTTHLGIFVCGTALIVVAAAVFIFFGTAVFFRISQVCFFLYVVGAFLVPVLVGLFTSHSSFLSSFNVYAAHLGVTNATTHVTSAAAKAGFVPSGYTLHGTIYAVSAAWFIFGFIFSSNYFAGEIKNGSKTHFISIPGAVAFALLLLLILTPTFFHMGGREFLNQLGTAPSSAYGFGSTPQYPEIAAIGSGSPVLGALVMLGFISGIVAWVPMTLMLGSRCILAWSFDQVMPQKLSDVNERTHSPVWAVLLVAAIAVGSTAVYAFTTLLSTLSVLFPLTLSLVIVAITGIVIPYRRKDLFQATGGARKFAGIPVLSIVGFVALLGFAGAMTILLLDPGSGTSISHNWHTVLWAVGGIFVVGPAIFYISKFIRARQGIDIDLAYTEIPPE
jgi:basic amino acid/polyamine antiporter, APA family